MLRYFTFSLYLMLALASPPILALDNATPDGLWLARDEDGDTTGYITITEEHGIYTGVIKKGAHPDAQETICSQCKGERKNQKIIGMVMMKNVKAQDGVFVGDEILDPFTGDTYRVKLKMLARNKMEVRGYIGVSLLGRTQIWERVERGE
jgi:hypothetical protein